MNLHVVETTLLVLGVLVFLTAILSFVKRTGNIRAVLRFWEASMVLTKREFYISRTGISIMVISLCLRVYNQL